MNIRRLAKGISLLEVMIAFAATTVFVAVTAPMTDDLGVRLRVLQSMDVVNQAQEVLQKTCEEDQANSLEFDHSTEDNEFVMDLQLSADCANEQMKIVLWTVATGAEQDPIIELIHSAETAEWQCHVLQGKLQHVPQICRHLHQAL